MIRSFTTAKTGMIAQQNALDTSANNIANVNTTAYKSKQISFSDTLYSNINNEYPQSPNITPGNGVKTAGTYSSIDSDGALQQTQKGTDFAIIGDGLFKIQNSEGDTYYTRDGQFSISAENDGNFLVSSDGFYVMSSDNERIDLNKIPLDQLGSALGVFGFVNFQGLSNVGENRYVATNAAGNVGLIQAKVAQGVLESSNVDLTLEMTKLITSQRAYQFNAKVAQIADEIEQNANNLSNT